MAKVPVNTADWSAAIPDGPVNRHAHLTVYLDTDTGELSAEAPVEVARAAALSPSGRLPVEQRKRRGETHAQAARPAVDPDSDDDDDESE